MSGQMIGAFGAMMSLALGQSQKATLSDDC
jgi:hypothetical protein